MNISFKDIEENISEILAKWMGLNKQINPIIETLIELNERGREFTIKDFLAITQCADGLHRMFINEKQMPFAKRLKKLYSELMFINRIEFSEGEIQRIVKNRDYYTHLHQDKGVDFFSIPELYHKTRKLYALVLFSILKEIGFTKEMLIKYGEDDYLY